ncbi:MAG: hypothetical protein HC895_26555 [Leptolyngbyaceae cyanobacterium SM1_3_5]|nr:hypothetical protein [Leptolyngbyaceae cyanobacterium SM1_3_5]
MCTFVTSATLAEQLQRWSEQPQVLERYRLQIFHLTADFCALSIANSTKSTA